MELSEAINGRHCIRRFRPDEMEEEKVEGILEAAREAPSAGNLQARDFIVVRDSKKRRELAEAALSQNSVSEAPLVIVVCANPGKSAAKYGSRGEELYCIQDATAAVQNILLAVHSLGLGACWVGAFDENSVREVLGIPSEIRPVAIIPIGYSAEEPSAPPKNMEIHNEHW
ncbi:MAG: nitroreductase family protein [Candidatus Altiarchaeales archaeon]|nr:nitroreductase family protein [Candidatus Altiarchaeota archaeon]MBU4341421.1 nitroreductase family protein [Candidatus Altiarchaeota archaeon]MBU4436868.1 nitroreductase family protein [Candidatus Altiarchaeota archaeon]MCG2782619.1 nitroreductase family protein [Candidatus Altiarchaeales archaeon]